jgi:hypothetical protein
VQPLEVCGDPSTLTDKVVCALSKGHAGHHESYVPSWTWERSKL